MPTGLACSAPTDSGEFGVIRQAWDLLHSEYVGASDLDSSDMAHAAIRAMTEAVGDTGHTVFLTPEEAAAEEQDLSGTYVGIGVDLDESGTTPVVTSVVTDGPADRAGLQAGDRIVEIDGASTDGMSDQELTDALRGPTVARSPCSSTGREEGASRFRVTRGAVALSAVDWAMVPGTSVALVQLAIFSDGAADELAQALAQVHSAGATGIVLDLRGNPGGMVDEAVGVASEFIASGIVVQSRDADGVFDLLPSTGRSWTRRRHWSCSSTPIQQVPLRWSLRRCRTRDGRNWLVRRPLVPALAWPTTGWTTGRCSRSGPPSG